MYQIRTKDNKVIEVSYNGKIVYYTGNINRALSFINNTKGV